jgi:hypothetical protein
MGWVTRMGILPPPILGDSGALYMLTARYVLKNVIPSFCIDAHAPMSVELQTKLFVRITLQTYLLKD